MNAESATLRLGILPLGFECDAHLGGLGQATPRIASRRTPFQMSWERENVLNLGQKALHRVSTATKGWGTPFRWALPYRGPAFDSGLSSASERQHERALNHSEAEEMVARMDMADKSQPGAQGTMRASRRVPAYSIATATFEPSVPWLACIILRNAPYRI